MERYGRKMDVKTIPYDYLGISENYCAQIKRKLVSVRYFDVN